MNDAVALGADGAAIAQARAQLTVLARLQRRIADASPVGLASMRGEVTATVAATQAITLQGTPSGAQPYRTAQVALERASEAARATTKNFMHAFYDEHVFDKYLKFASIQDEEEYRRHEAERQQQIQKALDEHTPEGDLRANRLAIEQLKDAGAHGADKSPDYVPTMKKLTDTQNALSAAIEKTPKAAAQDRLSAASGDAPAATSSVPPSVLAGFKNVGVTPDHQAEGSGVSTCSPKETGPRCPS